MGTKKEIWWSGTLTGTLNAIGDNFRASDKSKEDNGQ